MYLSQFNSSLARHQIIVFSSNEGKKELFSKSLLELCMLLLSRLNHLH